jgi:ketosteroid isomerase-like protein
MISVERNKAVVHRLFEIWNTGNLDAIEELYAADYVADYRPYPPLRHGYDAIKGKVQRAQVAFPDYHEELTSHRTGLHRGYSRAPPLTVMGVKRR